jgi:hypothetical protein
MSFCYSTIAFAISVANAGTPKGSVGGMPFDSNADKTFEILNAMGAILFAFSFSMIVSAGVGQGQPRRRSSLRSVS